MEYKASNPILLDDFHISSDGSPYLLPNALLLPLPESMSFSNFCKRKIVLAVYTVLLVLPIALVLLIVSIVSRNAKCDTPLSNWMLGTSLAVIPFAISCVLVPLNRTESRWFTREEHSALFLSLWIFHFGISLFMVGWFFHGVSLYLDTSAKCDRLLFFVSKWYISALYIPCLLFCGLTLLNVIAFGTTFRTPRQTRILQDQAKVEKMQEPMKPRYQVV